MNDEQRKKVSEGKGFIAALDQSGGSTPKALRLYGLEPWIEPSRPPAPTPRR